MTDSKQTKNLNKPIEGLVDKLHQGEIEETYTEYLEIAEKEENPTPSNLNKE